MSKAMDADCTVRLDEDSAQAARAVCRCHRVTTTSTAVSRRGVVFRPFPMFRAASQAACKCVCACVVMNIKSGALQIAGLSISARRLSGFQAARLPSSRSPRELGRCAKPGLCCAPAERQVDNFTWAHFTVSQPQSSPLQALKQCVAVPSSWRLIYIGCVPATVSAVISQRMLPLLDLLTRLQKKSVLLLMVPLILPPTPQRHRQSGPMEGRWRVY